MKIVNLACKNVIFLAIST